jgi:hypothetical protein
MEYSEPDAVDPEIGKRTKRLLREAEAWCKAPGGKGRMTKLAKYVGCNVSAVSAWFREVKKAQPRKKPTAEQILALEAFLRFQQDRDDLSDG